MKLLKYILCCLLLLLSTSPISANPTPDFWKNATVYFLLTDRFNNGDPGNDRSYDRNQNPSMLRGFEGGDIQGVINKVEDGYFSRLGVNAIWMTPVIEQIHGYDDSDGLTYAYHGYWPKDWTSVDANFGSEEDFAKLVSAAHSKGIKVLVDVIINHTGPATKSDWAWPDEWIRTQPICNWKSFKQNTQCALATSLTDIKTESRSDVGLPPELLEKWRTEGRLEQEQAELEDFFKRTGYPRAPKYYIMKWLTDWVRDYGIDGFRVDTVKHVEAQIWKELKQESQYALEQWRAKNPEKVKHELPFYMVGEVFNWGLNGYRSAVENSRSFDYGDKQVDFFNYGFDALINMGFVAHIKENEENLFSAYSDTLNDGAMQGKGVINYIGSHDDHESYDRERQNTYEAAFKLMMSPGGVQIYYGDELARPMFAKDAFGDANMRSFMNWQDLTNVKTQALLSHWQRLGTFRREHQAVGAGKHAQLQASPYIFKRELSNKDKVLVAKGLPIGKKSVSVFGLFDEDEELLDYYSGITLKVANGKVDFSSEYEYLLLGRKR